MPLPKITTAQYELKLPSTGKTVKYRPFLVREEKVLILSLETGDQKQISNAVKQVLKECVLTKGVKIDTLPSFDIEYLFLNIRAKSVGETINLLLHVVMMELQKFLYLLTLMKLRLLSLRITLLMLN